MEEKANPDQTTEMPPPIGCVAMIAAGSLFLSLLLFALGTVKLYWWAHDMGGSLAVGLIDIGLTFVFLTAGLWQVMRGIEARAKAKYEAER